MTLSPSMTGLVIMARSLSEPKISSTDSPQTAPHGRASSGGGHVINLDVGAHYFLVLPVGAGTPLVRLVSVNTMTGHLCFTGTPGFDLFRSVTDAVAAAPKRTPASPNPIDVETVLSFSGFVGGYATDDAIHLAFVTEDATNAVPASSPMSGVLRKVKCISWVNFALHVPASSLALQLDELNFSSTTPTASGPRGRMKTVPPLAPGGTATPGAASSSTADHHHHQPLYFRDFAQGILASDDNQHHYFFYSHVCDAAQCDGVEAAIASSAQQHSPGGGDDNSHAAGSSLHRAPARVVLSAENAISMTEFLWNVELIRFCEFFELGDSCCRLSFGSFQRAGFEPATSSAVACDEVVWVTRVSRYCLSAVPSRASVDRRASVRSRADTSHMSQVSQSSLHSNTLGETEDGQQQHSPLEAEGQLLLIRRTKGRDDAVGQRSTVHSMVLRRGGNFSRHADLINFNNAAAASANDFSFRPLASTFVAEYWKAMPCRYGRETVIDIIIPEPVLSLHQHATLPAATHRTGSSPFVLSPTDSPRISASKRDSPSKSRHADPESGSVSTPLLQHQLLRESSSGANKLMAYLAAAGLGGNCVRGAFFRALREIFLPTARPASSAERQDRSAGRSTDRDISYSFRVFADDERDAFSTMLCGCVVALIWAATRESLREGRPDKIDVTSVTSMWRVMVPLFLESSWWASGSGPHQAADHQGTNSATAKSLLLFATDLLNVLTDTTPVAEECSGLPVPLSRRREQLIERHVVEASSILWNLISTHDLSSTGHHYYAAASFLDDTTQNVLRSILAEPRRCNATFALRPSLLSHPGSGARVIRSQLLVSSEESERPSTRSDPVAVVPHAGAETEASAAGGGSVPWELVRDLCDPQLHPLVLPETTEGINFTISLPAVSVLTHLGLFVQHSNQNGLPFSSALTISCTVGEYLSSAFGRVVLQELPLPIAVGGHGSPSLVLIPLIFTIHQHAATVLPYRYEDDAPVAGRFVKITLRGSGKIPLMISPIAVFGFPIAKAPEILRRHVQTLPMGSVLGGGGGGTIATKLLDISQQTPLIAEGRLKSTASRQFDDDPNCTGDDCKSTVEKAKFATAKKFVEALLDGGGGSSGLEPLDPTSLPPTSASSVFLQPPPPQGQTNSNAFDLSSRNEAFVAEISATLLDPDRKQCTLHHMVNAEYTRLRLRVSRRSRDRCYNKLQKLMWLVNPSFGVFPTPSNPAYAIRRDERDGKRCFKCDSRMMFLTTKVECRRCYRIFCQRCIAPQQCQVLEHGVRDSVSSVCYSCQQEITTLQRVIVGAMQANEKSWNQLHADCRILIPFLNPEILPRITIFEATLAPQKDRNKSGSKEEQEPYNLCVANMCQVIECPQLDFIRERGLVDSSVTPFERVLGGSASSGWQILPLLSSPQQTTPAVTNVSSPARPRLQSSVETTMQVLLRLQVPAHLHHWRMMYTLSPSEAKVSVTVVAGPSMLHLDGPKIQETTLEHNTQHLLEVHFEEQVGDGNSSSSSGNQKKPVESLIVALRFRGSQSDLAGLQIHHFSLWGRYISLVESPQRNLFPKSAFLIVPDAAPPSAKRYSTVDFLHFVRHSHGSTPTSHFTSPAPSATNSGAAALALPKELPGARLIQVKHSQPLTSCAGAFVTEFELSTPMTVCGFVLENCYAGFIALTSTNRLATVLRLIGTSSTGSQDNIGVFRIPNVMVHNNEHVHDVPPPAVAFAFPTSNHTLVSIMVEVLEWRHVPNTCVGHQNPPPHVGKVHFWTSPAVKTRRVVSSASFFSAHSSVTEGTVLVKKKSTT